MNITTTASTATSFASASSHTLDRYQIRTAWRIYWEKQPAHAPSAAQLALYALLLGDDLSKTFTPIRHPARLANGHAPYGAAKEAIRLACTGHPNVWAPFASLLIAEGIDWESLKSPQSRYKDWQAALKAWKPWEALSNQAASWSTRLSK